MGVANRNAGQVRSIDADNYLSARPANVIYAQELFGQDVISKFNDEKIGSIENLVIDEGGDIVRVVIAMGGFLGMGEKTVAIAWNALQISTAENNKGFVIRVNADRKSLENAIDYGIN